MNNETFYVLDSQDELYFQHASLNLKGSSLHEYNLTVTCHSTQTSYSDSELTPTCCAISTEAANMCFQVFVSIWICCLIFSYLSSSIWIISKFLIKFYQHDCLNNFSVIYKYKCICWMFRLNMFLWSMSENWITLFFLLCQCV